MCRNIEGVVLTSVVLTRYPCTCIHNFINVESKRTTLLTTLENGFEPIGSIFLLVQSCKGVSLEKKMDFSTLENGVQEVFTPNGRRYFKEPPLKPTTNSPLIELF